ncbi:MAG: PEGA domain-containing protein [Gammaproteobacteria bacterium]|nr:PEGA domain-containing protein [Gammaproteobacteria bacterium]
MRFSVAYTDTEYATLPPVAATAAAAPGPAITAERLRAPPPAGRRRRPWWLYGSLALLALLALELFTARAVGIQVTPAQARVTLRGSWLPLQLGGRYLLHPGRYTVELAADGHEPLTAPLVVGEERSQDFHFSLKPLPGRLVLEGAPSGSLQLSVDGQPQQPAADGSYAVAAGSHRLRVVAARYQPYETTVEVTGRGERQAVRVALVPDWADVDIRSEPPGARISVGGEALGVTPATVPVASGQAQIELRLEGYKPWRQSLQVTAGQKLTLPPVTLQEADGLLEVVSLPAGAAVSIDGRYRGVTPLETEIAPGRSHTVLVAKPGHETATRSVAVERRGSASLHVELAARLGVVRVESEPPDAEVLVDGVARGPAGQELQLLAVPHRIELRKAGYASYVTEVTPRPGMPQRVQARLLTPQQAVMAAVPKTVTTKQGQELRLVGPGEFETGAPRREQGRRPNETQRRVRITRAYYIGLREVTNREYREFRPSHTSGAEKYKQLAGSDHPVVMLGWEDAASYCNWLSDREGLPPAYVLRDGALRLAEPATRGYRLPTEAEWEWASRYNGGGGERRYPWGDQMPPEPESGNFADKSARGIVANVLGDYDDGYPVTAPVGRFRPSPLGFFDLGGNAAEWVNDRYSVYGAGDAVLVDPQGADTGQYHVIRGSSWRQASISELRFAYRDFGDQGRLDVGFRLARNAD